MHDCAADSQKEQQVRTVTSFNDSGNAAEGQQQSQQKAAVKLNKLPHRQWGTGASKACDC